MSNVTPRLTCMRGYPGSGKSTIARTLPGVVVSRDDLRKALYGTYRPGNDGEEAVTVAERAMVKALLSAGRDVVVDAMHVNPRYLRQWAKMSHQLGVRFTVHDVRTPVEDCIWRDTDTARQIHDKSVGRKVIEDIAKRFPMENWPDITAEPFHIEPVVPRLGLPPAIIVDIDGTLAHMTDRSPYDYSRVLEDTVDETIRGLVDDWLYASLYRGKVLIVSGRDHTCREDTIKWLKEVGCVYYDYLWMRDADVKDERGNKIPDYIVKYNLFNQHIRNKFNVQFVLDDRTQVVEMWRKLGLKCLQVAPGDF